MGSATQYTRLSRTLMPMAETSARISIMGQRMAIRDVYKRQGDNKVEAKKGLEAFDVDD